MIGVRRWVWVVLAAVVALVAIAALALPRLIDPDRFRGLIESRARALLGREVSLGEIRLSFRPVFGVRIDDLAVGALPEEGGGQLLEAASLRIGARLRPLLSGRLEATEIVLDRPRLLVVRDREGRWNVSRIVGA